MLIVTKCNNEVLTRATSAPKTKFEILTARTAYERELKLSYSTTKTSLRWGGDNWNWSLRSEIFINIACRQSGPTAAHPVSYHWFLTKPFRNVGRYRMVNGTADWEAYGQDSSGIQRWNPWPGVKGEARDGHGLGQPMDWIGLSWFGSS